MSSSKQSLKDFEKKIIEALTHNSLAPSVIASVLQSADFAYDEPSSGYFLTLSRPDLPEQRIVCNRPALTASDGKVTAGFVVYLEQRSLTLECHSWDGSALPKNFRELELTLGEAAI